MPMMTCDRCDTMKNGVYWVQFNEGNTNAQYSIMSAGHDSPDRHYRMCRKCRNQYRNLIHIPLWIMSGCQIEKFEALINEFRYEVEYAKFLNQENPSPDGIPIFVVLPPVISYYGLRVSFENDGFN